MADSGFVDVEGGRLYYEVEGEGPGVLLIHGGLGSLRMWDGQVATLARRYRVARFDTRGFGRTETDAVEFSNRADAVAVLDHVGLERVHLVGQSRGGVIGLDLVLEFPERVRSFTSVAGGIGGFVPELPDGVQPPPWDELEALWEAKEWDALAEQETRVWVDGWGQPPTRVDPALRARVKTWIVESYLAGKEEGKPQGLEPPAVGRLGEIRVPLLVVVGLSDEAGTVVAGRHLAGSVDRAELVELDGVAHMVHLERPAEFDRLLLDFLAGVDASD